MIDEADKVIGMLMRFIKHVSDGGEDEF